MHTIWKNTVRKEQGNATDASRMRGKIGDNRNTSGQPAVTSLAESTQQNIFLGRWASPHLGCFSSVPFRLLPLERVFACLFVFVFIPFLNDCACLFVFSLPSGGRSRYTFPTPPSPPMSWRSQLSKRVNELRVLYCQKGASSAGARYVRAHRDCRGQK